MESLIEGLINYAVDTMLIGEHSEQWIRDEIDTRLVAVGQVRTKERVKLTELVMGMSKLIIEEVIPNMDKNELYKILKERGFI